MTQQVKLSKDTLEVLKMFSTINGSLAFKAGNKLRTISPGGGAVFAEVEIPEEFPIPFNIYELNRFLSVLSLATMKEAVLEFSDDKKVVIKGTGGTKINYYFTSDSFVTAPDRELKLPSVDLDVTLTPEVIDGFMRAASALGHKIMAFTVRGDEAFLVGTSPELGDASNDYEVSLGTVEGASEGTYRLKIENIKLLAGDYRVQVCARGMVAFSNEQRKLKVFVGLEMV